ncbi:MAG: hypothetical protein WBX14_11085, partial [Candidatus Udaeobacter sp.]
GFGQFRPSYAAYYNGKCKSESLHDSRGITQFKCAHLSEFFPPIYDAMEITETLLRLFCIFS